MTEVAKLIGYDKRTIHRHFPSICRAISAKYLANLHQTRLERLNIACTLVQEAVEQLYTQEIYPTQANVTKFLRKPGIFRDKEVKVAFHQARKKLGLEN
ncbi:hypothetical protein PCC7424_5664 (plasmid) [Gloeothece citriformis PCC 7424]|uniref:Uncharacterized protein n=1 Tax=Gloeothece citriformis (strain PCC 7424) TaxID=65393 RepID=B7KLQ9_GLOC7|nr:hypothetical protein [Gloeothece citriformis]ACK73731.1 hypothetical protein PCC7424_5664 [Gloeothece citriformis PCC 7424]